MDNAVNIFIKYVLLESIIESSWNKGITKITSVKRNNKVISRTLFVFTQNHTTTEFHNETIMKMKFLMR